MGFKFRKSIKVAPGVKVNVTHKGIGVSAGVKGAHISTGPSGSRITTSIPGTGISYEQRISKKKGSKQRTSSNDSRTQNTTATTPDIQSHTSVQSSATKKVAKTFKVTPFRSKDSKTNSIARKLMKPLSIITGVCAVLFLIMMLVIPTLILAAISFLCYKNIKIPYAAVCPGCNTENLLIYKEKKITCRKCKSTLHIQK
ncbi:MULTISPECIES: DUF4236 domain-containing protein [Bacillus cereus group]|uniref:DUF4236 domain-containing protein n=1 Tax=Bacillus cereus group TaxID=86661 RepID=UPI000B4A6EFD|nr:MULTISPECIES: DUF4236 domain-containing protein [Bacillus cereus group]MBY5229321.1 hypothetical protein [Bacillus paranthracis]MCY9249088.1 DUF4236 domain-containing protein [Bacillus paranthracis]MDR4159453.1 DUF4236 domain-containing protein [Bacillus paranthracis]MDR4416438.1 DUF4236 domain-containing protein [Bacillus paranthracis]MED1515746.1 DUF4236 domain-containing protein [Bacillus paranthracis]